MNRLLIVANDNSASEMIVAQLEHLGGFRATRAATVAEAIERARSDTAQFDAVLLVTGRTEQDTCTMCARLRQALLSAPIIILASQAGECDVISGLEAGASDFIIAPYRVPELQARLRAQIRAHANSADVVLVFGPYRFQPATRVLDDPSRGTIRLTQKETEVLKYLYRAAGRPVARQVLLRDVWGYKHGADSYTVESHIYRLRRKIETDPAHPRFLVNEDGGYVLVSMPARPWAPAGLSLAG